MTTLWLMIYDCVWLPAKLRGYTLEARTQPRITHSKRYPKYYIICLDTSALNANFANFYKRALSAGSYFHPLFSLLLRSLTSTHPPNNTRRMRKNLFQTNHSYCSLILAIKELLFKLMITYLILP